MCCRQRTLTHLGPTPTYLYAGRYTYSEVYGTSLLVAYTTSLDPATYKSSYQ